MNNIGIEKNTENEVSREIFINDYVIELSKTKSAVLATSVDNTPTARFVSIVNKDEVIYFMTDSKMDKVKQIDVNDNVCICFHNYEIIGKAKRLGALKNNIEIASMIELNHNIAYDRYSNLTTQIIVEIVPAKIKKWTYQNGIPYMEFLDFEKRIYEKKEYLISKKESCVINL